MLRRSFSFFFGACLSAIALLAAHRAEAEPLRGSLEIERMKGAKGCPDAAAMVKRVEDLAGAPILSGKEASEVQLAITIARSPKGYEAKMTIAGARQGERMIEDSGPTCKALAEALAVTILIVLDAAPGLAPEPPPPEPPTPAEPTEPAPAPAPSPATLKARRKLRPFWLLPAIEPYKPEKKKDYRPPFAAAFGAIYDFGTLDDATGGLAISADAYLPWVSFALGLTMLPRDDLPRLAFTVVYDFYAAFGRVCFQPLSRSLGFGLCTGFLAGSRRARVSGDPIDEVATSEAYIATTFEVELSGALTGPLGVFASMGVATPLYQGSLELEFPRGGRAAPLEAPVSFQLTAGTRIWFDLR